VCTSYGVANYSLLLFACAAWRAGAASFCKRQACRLAVPLVTEVQSAWADLARWEPVVAAFALRPWHGCNGRRGGSDATALNCRVADPRNSAMRRVSRSLASVTRAWQVETVKACSVSYVRIFSWISFRG